TLERIDRDLAAPAGKLAGPVGERRWWVNSQGQTFALVPGPVEFWMGSPDPEPKRFVEEVQHRRRISRSFAVAMQEVTVAQYQRFLQATGGKSFAYREYCPEPACPMLNISWYRAALYCRWLSEQE